MVKKQKLPIDSLVEKNMVDKILNVFKQYTNKSVAKAIYTINSYLPNRNLLDLYITLNYGFKINKIEGIKEINTYFEFTEFAQKIISFYKPNPMNTDIQIHDLGEIQIPFADNIYPIIVGSGHNHSFIFHYFIDEIAVSNSIGDDVKELLEFNTELINNLKIGFDGRIDEYNHKIIIPSEKHFEQIYKTYDYFNERFSKLKVNQYFFTEDHPNKLHFIDKNNQSFLLFNTSIVIDYVGHEISKLANEQLIKVVNRTIQRYLINQFELSGEQNHVLNNAFIMDNPKGKPITESIATILLNGRVVIFLNECVAPSQESSDSLHNQIMELHKQDKLHIMAYYKKGYKVYPIKKEIDIDFITINNHINITEQAIFFGEYGKPIKIIALDFLYFILRANSFSQIMNFLDQYKNTEQQLFSSDGLSGLFESTLNTEGTLEMGAVTFSSVLIDLYTPEKTVQELFKNEFNQIPIITYDYLFDNPFHWKINDYKNGFVYAKRKGSDLLGIVRKHENKGYVFICRNKKHFNEDMINHEEINHIQTLDDLLSFMFDYFWETLKKVGFLDKEVQIFIIPEETDYEYQVRESEFKGKYLKGDSEFDSEHYTVRITINQQMLFENIYKSQNREVECDFFREIFKVVDNTFFDIKQLDDEIISTNQLPKITNVGYIRIPYYKNMKNLSYWPDKPSFISVRKRIAQICQKAGIEPSEYRLEDAKLVIRKLQDTLISDFKSMIQEYYYLDLHVMLLSLLAAIQFDILTAKDKIFIDDSMIEKEIADEYREQNIKFREDKKSELRYLLYLIEMNLKYGNRNNVIGTKRHDVRDLLAYADWFVVLQDNADSFHWKMDTSSIEVSYDYRVNTNFTDDTIEKYKTLSERIYNSGSFVSEKVPNLLENVNLLDAFMKDFGFSFDAFIKVLGILSDNGDEKDSYEIYPDVIRFDVDRLVDIMMSEIPELHTKEKALAVLNQLTVNDEHLSYIFKEGIIKDMNVIPIWEREYRPNRFDLKPLTSAGDSYIFSPIICYQTLMLWSNSFVGLYPVHEYNMPNILSEIDRLKKVTQDDMVQAIYNFFQQKGYKSVFKELKLHKRGKHPDDLGDYDILVYDETNNTIWNIESKVIQQVGSISEFAKQQNTFFLKNEYDKKFQRRIDYLVENSTTILTDLKIKNTKGMPVINNLMVTNKVFISEFKEVDFSIISFGELKRLI